MTQISNNGAATAAVNNRDWEETPAADATPASEFPNPVPQPSQGYWQQRDGLWTRLNSQEDALAPTPGSQASAFKAADEGAQTYALAAMLRLPALAPLWDIGVNEPRLQCALGLPVWPMEHVWHMARILYSSQQTVPDHATLRAALLDDRPLSGLPLSAARIDECLNEVYGPRYANLTVEQALPQVKQHLLNVLCLRPVRRRLTEYVGDHCYDSAVAPFSSIAQEIEAFNANARQRLFTADEVLADTSPIEWFVPALMPKHETLWIGGGWKTCKSGLLLALFAALAAILGHQLKRFMGRFLVSEQVPCLLYSGESGAVVARSRLRAMGFPAGCPLHLGFFSPQLGTKEGRRQVARDIRATEARVVGIDPLYRSLAKEKGELHAGNIFDMGEAIGALEDAILDAGATPIIAHHFKRDGLKLGKLPTLEQLTQAGGAERAAAWWLLNHRKAYDLQTGTFRLFLEVGSRLGNSSSWGIDLVEGVMQEDGSGRVWQPHMLTPEEYQAGDEELGGVVETGGGFVNRSAAVRHALRLADWLAQPAQTGQVYSRNALRDVLHCNVQTIDAALAELERQNWVTSVPQTNGHPAYHLSAQGRQDHDARQAALSL